MRRGTKGSYSAGNMGFSLFELTAVLSLFGILLFIGAITFQHVGPKFRLQAAAWEIYSRLNYARYKAVFEAAPVRLRFSREGYAIEKYDDAGGRWKTSEKHDVEGVELSANNTPTFYPEGTVSNLATIIVANSRGTYRITIAISGRVKAVRL